MIMKGYKYSPACAVKTRVSVNMQDQRENRDDPLKCIRIIDWYTEEKRSVSPEKNGCISLYFAL